MAKFRTPRKADTSPPEERFISHSPDGRRTGVTGRRLAAMMSRAWACCPPELCSLIRVRSASSCFESSCAARETGRDGTGPVGAVQVERVLRMARRVTYGPHAVTRALELLPHGSCAPVGLARGYCSARGALSCDIRCHSLSFSRFFFWISNWRA